MNVETQTRIQAALQAQDFETAARLADAALANGEAHETLFRLAALHRQGSGDLTGAADMLLNAVRLSPHDPAILTAAADALRQVGQLQHAVQLFDDALARDGAMVAAWYGRALALEAAGALEDARDSYQRVTELAPGTAPGFAGLSTTDAQLGDKDAARRFAAQAHTLAPDDPAACMALARCEMADGDNAAAVILLRQTALDQVDLLTLLGDALDGLGNFDDAFDAYAAANSRFVQGHGGSSVTPTTMLERLDDIERAVAALGPVHWPVAEPTAPRPAAGHVFLLGYPRSGTTLVEQALASLPNVVTLEEAPTLDDAQAYLTGEGVTGLSRLTYSEIDALRAAYWRRVTDHGTDVAGKVFVDMDPSKSMGLPVIARLFPDAKIIIMRRDPRDVIWSCFRRAFVYSPMTLEFSSLDRAAQHYDGVMRLTRTCLTTFPVTPHLLVYEDLVRDFDATTRALCDFLGIAWSADMRDFGATARTRRVRTASASQVRQSLFDGSGQWRNYAHKLRAVLPILEPWVDPFAIV
jgi:tetratricopeptide (TPR) repeat protein